jgi:NAD(P)H dehydrogenase (quinone)
MTQQLLTAAGWDVTYSDLYSMGFDPCEAARHYTARAEADHFHAQTEQRFNASNGGTPADVTQEIESILACDLLVVHFPLWWFGMPAILKGWIDRVFVYGKLYRSEMRYDAGICAGKGMLACVTTGASQDSCSFNGRESDTRMVMWPLLFPFRYLGFDVLKPEIFPSIGGVAFVEGHEQGVSGFEQFTTRWKDQLDNLDDRPITPYNRNIDYDDDKRLKPGAPEYSSFISHRSNPPKGWE